jgi:acyl-coenzyme A synthetase/AMP-(fatty) acid ligase
VIHDELPKTDNGKLDRLALAALDPTVPAAR